MFAFTSVFPEPSEIDIAGLRRLQVSVGNEENRNPQEVIWKSSGIVCMSPRRAKAHEAE